MTNRLEHDIMLIEKLVYIEQQKAVWNIVCIRKTGHIDQPMVSLSTLACQC